MVRRFLLGMLPLVGAALLAGSALTTPARAAQPLSPAQPVVDPGCRFDVAIGDAEVGPDGLTRGFVQFVDDDSDCDRDQIYFFQQRPDGGWESELSPYAGSLRGVAQDRTGTYLLFAVDREARHIRITKRTTAGAYTPARTLQTCQNCAVEMGDVIAEDGRWWAVWDTAGGLVQARTIGTNGDPRVTGIDAADSSGDLSPRLARKPSGDAVLTWTKYGEHAEVWVATTEKGDWSPRRLRGDSLHSYYAGDVAVSKGRMYFTYEHMRSDGSGVVRVSVADGQDTDALSQHTFKTGGDFPRVAVSDGYKFVTWTATAQQTLRVFLAEWDPARRGWTGGFITPADQALNAFAVTANDGKATVLMASDTALYARTEQ